MSGVYSCYSAQAPPPGLLNTADATLNRDDTVPGPVVKPGPWSFLGLLWSQLGSGPRVVETQLLSQVQILAVKHLFKWGSPQRRSVVLSHREPDVDPLLTQSLRSTFPRPDLVWLFIYKLKQHVSA